MNPSTPKIYGLDKNLYKTNNSIHTEVVYYTDSSNK